MEAFQDLRQGRCERVHDLELMSMSFAWAPPGPERDLRDQQLRPTLEGKPGEVEWDEGHLRAEWERMGDVFGYNAREAAENWWVHWGVLRESSKAGRPFDPMNIEVTKHTTETG